MANGSMVKAQEGITGVKKSAGPKWTASQNYKEKMSLKSKGEMKRQTRIAILSAFNVTKYTSAM